MKLLSILLVTASLVGCASAPRTAPTQAISYDQLKNLNYTNRDCPQINEHIAFLEAQLRARGFLNVDPETLNEPDRMYNATARVMIWNLRIGCNNPNRFSKK